MRLVRHRMHPPKLSTAGAMLLGMRATRNCVDLQKDPAIIERAYNDSDGVTAEFNLNVLRHLNREFGADFDLDTFSHLAEYNREEGRIELRLVSSRDSTFSIGGEDFVIAKDEAILTEYSHKYTLEGFAEMAHEAGFEVHYAPNGSQQLPSFALAGDHPVRHRLDRVDEAEQQIVGDDP